ncbi:MAG: hypothetical protein GC129_03670 [Proteobacteria bacterium]|nr:hypothetical protein [Pseudomonadota bacterium]
MKKATFILVMLLSACTSIAHADGLRPQTYIIHPTSCYDCPQEVEALPPSRPGVPKAGVLPAPIAAPHISGLPMGSRESAPDPSRYASISPAAQAELRRLGLVAVAQDKMKRLLEAVDEHLALTGR